MRNNIASKFLVSFGLALALALCMAQFHGKSSEPDRMSIIPSGGWIKTQQCALKISLLLLEEQKWPLANLPRSAPKILRRDGLWVVEWIPTKGEVGVARTVIELDARTSAVVRFQQNGE